MMPKVDGLTVLRRMRDEGKSVPILMLTAKSEIRDRVEGLDSGANDYLTKPFAAAELLARIRVLTRPDPSQANKNPVFGDLTLDVDASQLVCGDERCDLTQREFQMMEVMMRRPGQKISVDQFMRSVWGGLSDVETSVVWVNISNLRKKLAKLGSSVRISASRGVGYYLEDTGEGDTTDAPADEEKHA
jgi:two-component system response regulator MprA